MSKLKTAWDWLSGKKTVVGVILHFLNGGLVAVGVNVPGLVEVANFLMGVGLVHKGLKLKNNS